MEPWMGVLIYAFWHIALGAVMASFWAVDRDPPTPKRWYVIPITLFWPLAAAAGLILWLIGKDAQ